MTAVNGDIELIAGINIDSEGDPIIGWRFSEQIEPTRIIYDLSGKDVYLKIMWGAGEIEHDSTEVDTPIVINTDEGIVTWLPSLEETLALPRGRVARYRLEWKSAVSGGDVSFNGLLASGFVIVGDGTPDIE